LKVLVLLLASDKLPVLIAFDTGLGRRAISNSLRNLIIYYADTRTFLKYYLDRRIDKNIPTIIRAKSVTVKLRYTEELPEP
ncbi:uncharacterized protein N7458_009286, partial [Penicillium daleae]